MTERVQVGDLSTNSIQPAARAIDSYVTPYVDKTGSDGLAQLANALKDISPAVGRYLDVKHKTYTEDEIRQGQEAARQNAMGWKQAIDDGVVPAGASPWYQKGFKHQRGEAQAKQYQDYVSSEYEKWDGKDSEDPTALSNFVAGLRTNFMQQVDQDGDTAKGFNPIAALAENNVAASHAKHHVTRIEEQRESYMYQSNVADTKQFIAGTIDLTEFQESLLNRSKTFYADGGSGTRASQLIVDSVVAAATESGDSRVLKLLKTMPAPSGKGTIGDTKYGREAMLKATDAIFNKNVRLDNYFTKQKKKDDDLKVLAISNQVYDLITENPLDESPELAKLEAAGTKIDKDFPKYVAAIRNAKHGAGLKEDAQKVSTVFGNIYDGSWGNAEIRQAVIRGDIRNPTTIQNAYRAVEKAAKVTGYGFSGLAEKVAKSYEKSIFETLKGSEYDYDGGKRLRARQAQVDYMGEMHEFQAKNPGATAREVNDHARETVSMLIEHYGGDLREAAGTVSNQQGGAAKALNARRNNEPEWTYKAVVAPSLQKFNELATDAQAGNANALTDYMEANGITTKEDAAAFIQSQQNLLGINYE